MHLLKRPLGETVAELERAKAPGHAAKWAAAVEVAKEAADLLARSGGGGRGWRCHSARLEVCFM